MPPCPAGFLTRTTRRCRSPRATSWCRDKPIEQFGADAVRYWAAAARLGLDATYDEGQMKIGRRLAIKLLNATKFALAIGREDENHHVGAAGNRKLEPCRRDRAAGPRRHGQDGPRGARSHRKRSTTTSIPRRWKSSRTTSGSSATTTSSWSRTAPTAPPTPPAMCRARRP